MMYILAPTPDHSFTAVGDVTYAPVATFIATRGKPLQLTVAKKTYVLWFYDQEEEAYARMTGEYPADVQEQIKQLPKPQSFTMEA